MEDVLKKILDAKLVTLIEVQLLDHNGPRPKWCRDDDFYTFHHQ